MTNSKLIVVNSVAVRVYEDLDKIFMEWFVATDSTDGGTFYKLDSPSEFLKMSLYVQNASKALQSRIDERFYGKYQENSIYGVIL